MLSGWALSSATVAATTDPFGGTLAYVVTDTSVSVNGNIMRAAGVVAGSNYVDWIMKQGSASASVVGLYYAAGGSAHRIQVTWNGASAPTITTFDGNGVFFTPVSLGSNWWWIRQRADSVTLSGTVNLIVMPDVSSVAGTGTVVVYRRSGILLGYPLDNPIQDDPARGGFMTVQISSGSEDAWDTGTDIRLKGDLRWIPKVATDNPPAHGWYGNGSPYGTGLTDICVNVGVRDFITSGRKRTPIVWVPDRTAVGFYSVASLVSQDSDTGIGLENDGTRRVSITLRGQLSFGLGY